MKQCVEVGICGSGPVLTGIETSLKTLKGFRVRRLPISLAESVWEIKMLHPHAVIFEMRAVEEAVIAAILRNIPGVRLIGIDSGRDSITVFSARARPVFSLENLAQAILDDE
ncbi:MAG TPA: hypothetical protein VN611_03520 [Patescibacteria group bacterium]|nr:hypothetical protein [Patescibacteria group bacterium]